MSGIELPGIITTPDKSVDLMQINERFEMDYDSTFEAKFPAMLEKEAKDAARRAASTYGRLRKWHWRSELGVEVDKSELQIALSDFGTTDPDFTSAVDQGAALNNVHNKVAFVVKMWFEVPRQRVEVFENTELAEPDGFVTEMPKDGELG